ncbi:MAG: hypothetical protein KBH82_07540 [Syntrophorhabdaceae bacterium]|nr:hypothetical protein [Syntrophorhabdaceae bacterium]
MEGWKVRGVAKNQKRKGSRSRGFRKAKGSRSRGSKGSSGSLGTFFSKPKEARRIATHLTF